MNSRRSSTIAWSVLLTVLAHVSTLADDADDPQVAHNYPPAVEAIDQALLERFERILDLDESQTDVIHQLHKEYVREWEREFHDEDGLSRTWAGFDKADYVRLRTSNRQHDEAFFQAIAPVLSDSQLERMIRVREARLRSLFRYRSPMNPTPVDVIDIYIDTTAGPLSEDELNVLAVWEPRFISALRDAHVGMYRYVQAMQMERQPGEYADRIYAASQDAVRGPERALLRLNEQAFAALQPLLDGEELETFIGTYEKASYAELHRDPEAVFDDYKAALAWDDHPKEIRATLEQMRDTYKREYDELMDRLIRQERSYRMDNLPDDPEKRREVRDKHWAVLAELLEQRTQLNERNREQIKTALWGDGGLSAGRDSAGCLSV